MMRTCPVTKEKQEEFICRFQQLLEAFPQDRVINIDETNWRVVVSSFWTWTHTGSEAVSSINESEKEGITVIGGIDTAGAKLPLTVVGKTQYYFVALNLPPEVWSVTSPTRWSTNDVMWNYFRLLRQHVYPTGPLVVLLDTFTAHRAVITKGRKSGESISWAFLLHPPMSSRPSTGVSSASLKRTPASYSGHIITKLIGKRQHFR
jgi:hypothetical protein